MPRFHFNVYDGMDIPDAEGCDLANVQAARIEAIRISGEILSNTAPYVALGEDWHMEITDSVGLILFRIDFTVIEAPATADPKA